MADNGKFTDKAAELAGQAAAAAGPLVAQAKERATVLAGQAAAAAGPITEQARVKAAQGVDVLAANLDKLTGGKYSEKIHSVATKVEEALDSKPTAPPVDPTLKAETAPLKPETAPLKPETPPLKSDGV
jgi:hypothetical protein